MQRGCQVFRHEMMRSSRVEFSEELDMGTHSLEQSRDVFIVHPIIRSRLDQLLAKAGEYAVDRVCDLRATYTPPAECSEKLEVVFDLRYKGVAETLAR